MRHREESRDVRLIAWLDSLRADAIFGWRQLKKKKVTSAAAILSLALGIGACTVGVPAHRRPAAAASSSRRARASLRALRMKSVLMANPERSTVGRIRHFRQMRAAVKDQAELIAISYAERTDLTYRSDQEMEKAYTAIRLRMDVQLFRTPACRRASAHRKRRSRTRRASAMPCSRMIIGRAASDRIRKSSGAPSGWAIDSLRDRRRGGSAFHRHRARHRSPTFSFPP